MQMNSEQLSVRRVSEPGPLRAAVEIYIVYASILAVIWAPRIWQHWLYGVPILAVVTFTALNFRGWSAMGFRVANLWRSLWVVALALVIAAAAWLIAWRVGTLHVPPTFRLFVKSYWGYALWSLVQQFLLLDFFLARYRQRPRTHTQAIWAAAGIFALAHLPNPILTPLTLLFGLITCALFLRYRNLWTLGLAHAILGITIACTVPGSLTHNMRVGLGYLRYQPLGRFHAQRPTPREVGPARRQGDVAVDSIAIALHPSRSWAAS